MDGQKFNEQYAQIWASIDEKEREIADLQEKKVKLLNQRCESLMPELGIKAGDKIRVYGSHFGETVQAEGYVHSIKARRYTFEENTIDPEFFIEMFRIKNDGSPSKLFVQPEAHITIGCRGFKVVKADIVDALKDIVHNNSKDDVLDVGHCGLFWNWNMVSQCVTHLIVADDELYVELDDDECQEPAFYELLKHNKEEAENIANIIIETYKK